MLSEAMLSLTLFTLYRYVFSVHYVYRTFNNYAVQSILFFNITEIHYFRMTQYQVIYKLKI
jgi:hypothetical protein